MIVGGKALFSVLRHGKLSSLNLSLCGINNDVLEHGLIQSLTSAPYLTELILQSNPFKADGLVKLTACLTTVKTLRLVDLSNCSILGPDYMRVNAVTTLLVEVC